jgi:hypothetical protein
MLWKTHLRICNWVCEDLGLPPGPSTIIKDSVIVPDKWKDYPHHHGKGGTIRKYVLEARKAFLNNEYQNTYYNLGIAFHYIQDAYTSFVWRSRNTSKRQAWHNKYEQWIQNSGYAEDLGYLIANTFKNDPRQKQYWMNILNYGSHPIEGKEATL